jgi:cytochrome c oxidase cbb3-type subunit 4
MDINIIREAVTVLSFALFVSIVGWAWSRGNRQRFVEAAQLPFDEDRPDALPRQGREMEQGQTGQGEGRPS